MTLETMEPNPAWVADAYGDTVETLSAHADELVYKIWGGDWCKDCRSQLPDLGAALEAAGVPDSNIDHYHVERNDDGEKVGPKVEEYGIEYIPTVVVERVPEREGDPTGSDESRASTDGELRANIGGESQASTGNEIARFVETEPVAIPIFLATEIDAAFR